MDKKKWLSHDNQSSLLTLNLYHEKHDANIVIFML